MSKRLIFLIRLGTNKFTLISCGCHPSRTRSRIWIKHNSIVRTQRSNQPFCKRNRKLTRVTALFLVACLDIWNFPHVPRILALRVAAKLALSRPFVEALTRVFLWYADRVQIEVIVRAFREPQDCLMTARKTGSLIQPKPESPDHSVAQGDVFDFIQNRKHRVNLRGRLTD